MAINKPYHSYPSFMKDFEAITKELRKQRFLLSFQDAGAPLLQSLKWENISQ